MDLCEALRRIIRRPEEGTRPGRPRSLEDVIQTFGSRAALYAYIAGSGPGTAAYRAASRRVQRYLQGTRRPSGEFMRQVRRRASALASRERRIERRRRLTTGTAQVAIQATIEVSADSRHRRVVAKISADCWERIIEAFDEDDCDTAEEVFSECFGELNGFGETPSFTDVDYLDPVA